MGHTGFCLQLHIQSLAQCLAHEHYMKRTQIFSQRSQNLSHTVSKPLMESHLDLAGELTSSLPQRLQQSSEFQVGTVSDTPTSLLLSRNKETIIKIYVSKISVLWKNAQ